MACPVGCNLASFRGYYLRVVGQTPAQEFASASIFEGRSLFSELPLQYALHSPQPPLLSGFETLTEVTTERRFKVT